VDSAPPQPAELNRPSVIGPSVVGPSVIGDEQVTQPNAILNLREISGLDIDEFCREADADSVALGKDELAKVLLAVGTKYNYGLPAGAAATRTQIGDFWHSLHLQELALAHACALGRDVAWQRFLALYREPLTQAAIGITRSATRGQELADSLYSEIFGLTERGGKRQSPLAYYSGRGSLKGFLRATLAQRNVDHHRRTHRETSLPLEELPAPPPAPVPTSDVLSRLGQSLKAALGSLTPEERFVLSAYFLDQRTLLEIARMLRVHEATVSRRVNGLTLRIRKDLLKNLRAAGMSRAAAEEALGTDPRDLDMNLRSLLQASRPAAFLQQGESADPEQT
jgi:RNA polymerase sigma-70 factor (ECF subfamily)